MKPCSAFYRASDSEPRAHEVFGSPFYRGLHMFQDEGCGQVAVPLIYRLENPSVFAEDLIEAQFLPHEDQ